MNKQWSFMFIANKLEYLKVTVYVCLWGSGAEREMYYITIVRSGSSVVDIKLNYNPGSQERFSSFSSLSDETLNQGPVSI